MKIGLVVRVQQMPSAESKVQINPPTVEKTKSLSTLVDSVAAREGAELHYTGLFGSPVNIMFEEATPKFWGDDQCED